MDVIKFKEANCKNCYRCIRNCPVRSITFINDQAKIIDDECILCGNCVLECPQNAKTVRSDVDKVKSFLQKGYKLYASVAPSFISAFENISWNKMNAILQKLGFTHIEETAIGAAAVSREYQALILQGKMKNIITSSCPTINFLIEKHYPKLLNQLAPVVSPMIAHGKMMKEAYGSHIKVVFIGPCISKKEECNDLQNENVIDAILTFKELEEWMLEGNTVYGNNTGSNNCSGNSSNNDTNVQNSDSRFYPTSGGILKTLNTEDSSNYKYVNIDGSSNCIDILELIKRNELSNYFIEMSNCKNSCLGGPFMKRIKGGILESRNKLSNYIKIYKASEFSVPLEISISSGSSVSSEDIKTNLYKKYINLSKDYVIPDEATIREILSKIRKFNKDMELNCGACGYPTCRDKAIAVYNKKANLEMCLPYMREKAESISNVIINVTPNAIIALDKELAIKEINLRTKELFKLNDEDFIGKSIFEILDCPDFEYVKETNQNILDKKYYYEQYGITVEQTILSIPDHHLIIVILKDITADEKQKQQIYKVRVETVDLAQKVIEKQMRVAQEIASLLGETTAETKVTLTKMKKTIQTDMGDI